MTTLLLKLFANSFYRAHAGVLLLILFVLSGLGKPGDVKYFHFSVMLAFSSNIMWLLVSFAVAALYALKTWVFILKKISERSNQFLFYSLNSSPKAKQMVSWLTVQAAVNAPILLYLGCGALVAITYGYYLAAIMIAVFIITLFSAGAFLCYRRTGKMVQAGEQSRILGLTASWKKPYFSLYLYHTFEKYLIKFLLLKGGSYLIITGMFVLFADVKSDIRIPQLAVLIIALSHSLLIFQLKEFEETYLNFVRTLPISRLYIFLSLAGALIVLLVPELVWILCNFPFAVSISLLAFCLSVCLLFMSILHWIGINPDTYMKLTFALFVALFWAIMFKSFDALTAINITCSFCIFYFSYYKFKHFIAAEKE
ncbi:MAG: hypothetical protein V4687_16845 [Bacteroidota bacterium]